MKKLYKSFFLCFLGLFILCGIAWMLRPYFVSPKYAPYEQEIMRYAARYDLPLSLVMAVIRAESNFDPEARSPKDAFGLMQITEDTLKWAISREGKGAKYQKEDLFNPTINIKYGCFILSILMDEFQNTDTALAAYNAGRGHIKSWLRDSRYSPDGQTLSDIPFQETKKYVATVNKYRLKYAKMLGEQP